MHTTRTESELRNDYYRAIHALDTAATPGGRRAAVHAALRSLHAMSQLIANRTGTPPRLDAEFSALEQMLRSTAPAQIDESLRRNAYFFLPRG